MRAQFTEYQSIAIDFEVYKALTAMLESATDSYNDVLRRTLGLRPSSAHIRPVEGSWVVDNTVFPNGTEFRAKFKGKIFSAVVEGGALLYEGRAYDSPSAAAVAVTGYPTNGWRFWECRFPSDIRWRSIDRLRK